MKKAVLIRVAVIILIISVLNLGISTVYSSLWTVRHVLIESDTLLSHTTQYDIEQFVLQMENQGTYNPDIVASLLVQKFSCVKSVSVQLLAHNTAEITIHAHEPYAMVNHVSVLTAQGALIDALCYDAAVCALCPQLTIRANPLPPSLSEHMMASLESAFNNDCASHYNLVLMNEHELRLYDKDIPNFYIACDAQHTLEQAILDKCQSLKKQLLARSGPTTKQTKQWRADIRFHDQIVVSMEKGGDYGSNIS